MTWFGVVNPAAGRFTPLLEDVVRVSHGLGLDATFEESSSGEDVIARVTNAVGEGYRRFIAVGGDGTNHLVVNALMASGCDERFTVGVVPVGSGADFVKTFGHERGVEAGLARIAKPELYAIDIGRVTGAFGTLYFVNAMNLGVGAAAAATANRFPRWVGALRYRTAFWLALSVFRGGRVSVVVDQHRYQGDAINVVVANGQFFGGGMNIAPRSTLVDGKMDVQVFLTPRRQAFVVMPRILMGTHLTHKGVKRYSGGSIRIDVPDSWLVEADGELIGSGSIEVEVLPRVLDFVI
ncbi:MAG: diacylglycerol kinase family protein [Actinomycetota bacterium]|nr:diacylglycerol kinase family protein [Actinomycetota bacterium]MDK1016016.1 diacylglycerol kinase family protein [Actinomycetota bacterium]MDK1025694.1 diacylglycerol kinase family protein [Actinomycetota bacterium]MDK1037648.1 diacylglycerol kinase family protein [Actinomycetota bacterium]MDK1095707.1 diacylglycerol kinase family protein [Actinomycetota bacterium]